MTFKELLEKLKTINVFDTPILGGSNIKTVHIYFNRLHGQIKFLKDIAKYGFTVGAKVVFFPLFDVGPGYVFMTLAKDDDSEPGVAITTNSHKDTPKSHVSCLSSTTYFFRELDIATQPKSNKKLKTGELGEKGFYVKAIYEEVMIKNEKRKGFVLNMEPWQNKINYEPSIDQNKIAESLLETT